MCPSGRRGAFPTAAFPPLALCVATLPAGVVPDEAVSMGAKDVGVIATLQVAAILAVDADAGGERTSGRCFLDGKWPPWCPPRPGISGEGEVDFDRNKEAEEEAAAADSELKETAGQQMGFEKGASSESTWLAGGRWCSSCSRRWTERRCAAVSPMLAVRVARKPSNSRLLMAWEKTMRWDGTKRSGSGKGQPTRQGSI